MIITTVTTTPSDKWFPSVFLPINGKYLQQKHRKFCFPTIHLCPSNLS